MPPTAAELAEDAQRFYSHLVNARLAVEHGLIFDAIRESLLAVELADSSLQHEKRTGNPTTAVTEAVRMAVGLAPLVFHTEVLDKLASVLKSKKRVASAVSSEAPNLLDQARDLMWQAHRVWDCVERQPNIPLADVPVVTGVPLEVCQNLVERWRQFGLVLAVRESAGIMLRLVTDLAERVTANCPRCGAVVRAAKQRLLEPNCCPGCKQDVQFVFRP